MSIQKRPIAPGRKKNRIYRSREYLTLDEVKRMIDVAQLRGRTPVRDQALLLLMFRHGLRASEAAKLRWDAVMLKERTIAITRCKKSESGTHPLQADELDMLGRLKGCGSGQYLFPSQRREYISTSGISKVVQQCGELAELPFKVHPHMLRHACGYHLANQGLDTRLIQDWLGHRNIQHTVRFTKLNSERFQVIQW